MKSITAAPAAPPHARPRRAAAAVPGQPVGRLELPVVTQRLSLTRRAPANPSPSVPDLAWLGLAADAIADIGSRGLPSFLDLPHLVSTRIEAHSAGWFKSGLVRRGLGDAHGMTSVYFWRCWPHEFTFAATELAESIRDLDNPSLRRLAAATAPQGRRLGFVHADGMTGGRLLDRLHYTHFAGHLRAPWMGEQVAADLKIGAALAGDAFLGVRVLANRALASSLHVTPDSEQHRLGGCTVCRPGGAQ